MNEEIESENVRIHSRADELIACLEGEIAKRDETIARLEADNRSKNGSLKAFGEQMVGLQKSVRNRERLVGLRDARIVELEADLAGTQSRVLVLQDQWRQLDAELAAIKAQEPLTVEFMRFMTAVVTGAGLLSCGKQSKGLAAELSATAYKYLLAAPVSEAKAQGVVMPERWNVPRPMWMDARHPYGNPLNHADIEAAEKFNLALDEVARLNAAQVSEAKAQGVVMPAELDRAFITGESCNGVYRVVIQSEKLKEMQAVHRWLASLNAAPVQQDQAFCKYCGGNDEEPQDHCMDCTRPVQQVSVPDGWRLVKVGIEGVQFGNAWFSHEGITGYTADQLNSGNCRITGRAYMDWLAAAPAAPAADAGLVEALDYQVLFDAIAAATSVYANGAINISVQAFRDALAAHRAKGVV